MEDNVLEQVPEFKLHKTRTILITTFLAGPLVGGFLIAENFRQLKERRKVIYTWIITIVVFAVLILTLFIPALEDAPSYLFAFINVAIAAFFVHYYQENEIKLHEQSGGEFFSLWRVILAAVISLVILVAALFLVLFLVDPAAVIE